MQKKDHRHIKKFMDSMFRHKPYTRLWYLNGDECAELREADQYYSDEEVPSGEWGGDTAYAKPYVHAAWCRKSCGCKYHSAHIACAATTTTPTGRPVRHCHHHCIHPIPSVRPFSKQGGRGEGGSMVLYYSATIGQL